MVWSGMSKPCPNLGMSAYICQACRGSWVWALWGSLLDISWQSCRSGVWQACVEMFVESEQSSCLVCLRLRVQILADTRVLQKRMKSLRFAGVTVQLSDICGLAVSQFLHHTNSWRPKKTQSLLVFLTSLLNGSTRMSWATMVFLLRLLLRHKD